MIPSIEEGKAAMLKAHAAVVKRDNPSWTFAKCWTLAQQQHPELKEEFADQEQEAKAASQPSYRYRPEKNPSTRASSINRAPLPKLETLLESLDRPVRVEARDREDDRPVKVYGLAIPLPLW